MFNPSDLNKHQRILLAIVGVAILLIQLYIFNEDGIEGSGWVLALLVASILILPSLSLIGSNTNAKLKGNEKLQTFINQSRRGQIAFERIKQKSDSLNQLLAEITQVQDIPSHVSATETMKEEWGRKCYLYVAALSIAAEFKNNPDFISNINFKAFEAQVVKEVLSSSRKSAIKEGFGEMHDDARVTASIIRDWNSAKTAMTQFLDNLSAGRQQADAPMIEFLFGKLGMPDLYQRTLESPLRNFTKQTLLEFFRQKHK